MRREEDEENSLRNMTGGPVSILARQKESKFIVQAMMKITRPEKPTNSLNFRGKEE